MSSGHVEAPRRQLPGDFRSVFCALDVVCVPLTAVVFDRAAQPAGRLGLQDTRCTPSGGSHRIRLWILSNKRYSLNSLCGYSNRSSAIEKRTAFMTIYERALDFLADGDVIGVGSGRASAEFTKLLGERVRAGLHVRGVPTSQAAAALMQQFGIPILSLAEAPQLTVDVDGADEVDPNLDLIKGYGRALVREKIVAAASARNWSSWSARARWCRCSGSRGKLPVEVVPFALPLCQTRAGAISAATGPHSRRTASRLITRQRQHILDCGICSRSLHPRQFEARSARSPASSAPDCFSAWRIWCWSATTSST